MAAWLTRLLRRTAPAAPDHAPPDDPVTAAFRSLTASSAPAVDTDGALRVAVMEAAAPARRSISEQLADDPATAELRAMWQARWDEF